MRLADLGRVRKSSDGDPGVAFEYAVHDAVMGGEPVITDRVATALARVRITRGAPASILFAIEKSGSKQLVETARELITPESRSVRQARATGQASGVPEPDRSGLPSADGLSTASPQHPGPLEGGPLPWIAESGSLGRNVSQDQPRLTRGARRATDRHCPYGVRNLGSRSIGRGAESCCLSGPSRLQLHAGLLRGHAYRPGARGERLQDAQDAELPGPPHREVARIYVERRNLKVGEVLDAVGPLLVGCWRWPLVRLA